MRSRYGFVILAFVVVLVLPLQAVGTVTRTERLNITSALTRFTFTWVSDASGNVSGNAQTIGFGHVVQVKIVPNGGGTQPDDDYDFTLKDANGVDLLDGAGGDASNATGEYFLGDPPVLLNAGATLDIGISNAGNAKGGTVSIWVAR